MTIGIFPIGLSGGYSGFEDYNDTSTSAGMSLVAGAWTDIPNDGLGSFGTTQYSPPGVGPLINSSGQIDLSTLSLGDSVLVRADLRITPKISGACLDFRYSLGAGVGAYFLNQPTQSLSDGSREYPMAFLSLFYVGNANTRDNLITPQIKSSEDATLINLGSLVTVFRGRF